MEQKPASPVSNVSGRPRSPPSRVGWLPYRGGRFSGRLNRRAIRPCSTGGGARRISRDRRLPRRRRHRCALPLALAAPRLPQPLRQRRGPVPSSRRAERCSSEGFLCPSVRLSRLSTPTNASPCGGRRECRTATERDDSRLSVRGLSNGGPAVAAGPASLPGTRPPNEISSPSRNSSPVGEATWLILPVVICLSQRLSHACLSTCRIKAKPRMAH